MALDQSSFAQGIVDLAGRSFPKDPLEAGTRWARAYAQYAQKALSFAPTPAPPILVAGEQLLAQSLAATWRTSLTAPQTAQQIAAALTTFWFVPPVEFGLGVVTLVGGTAALGSALVGIYTSNQAGELSPDQCAQKIAAAVHAFTITVITTTPVPAAPPAIGPIS